MIFGLKINRFNTIEKARKGEAVGGEYLYRIAVIGGGKDGKRNWKYVYKEDVKKPLKVLELLKNFFHIEHEKLEKTYLENNIAKDYECTQSTYNQHVLEYFSRRNIWDRIFSKKENRDIAKKPIKQSLAEKKEKFKNDITKKEKKTVEEKSFTLNRTLMRKIWLTFSKTPEAEAERKNKLLTEKNAIDKFTVGNQEATNDTSRIPRQIESSNRRMDVDGRSGSNEQGISTEFFTGNSKEWILERGGNGRRIRIKRLYKNNVAEIEDKTWFANRLAELKNDVSTTKAFSVSDITEEDLKDCRLFTINGNALCAVRSDGYLMSVVKADRYNEKMYHLLEVAKEQGATHLECYEHLVPYYQRQGFEVTQTYDFDPQLALDGVDYQKEFPQYNGKPRYFEMKLSNALSIAMLGNQNAKKDGVNFTSKKESEWGTVYEMENGSPLEASKFLMKKKDGFVTNVFDVTNKNDKKNYKVGLIWGHDGIGLKKMIHKHIVEQNDFENLDDMLQTIQNVLENGKVIDTKYEKLTMTNGKYKIVIANDGEKYIVTAFDKSSSESTKTRTVEEQNQKLAELNFSVPNSITQEGTLLPETASTETIPQNTDLSSTLTLDDFKHAYREKRADATVSKDREQTSETFLTSSETISQNADLSNKTETERAQSNQQMSPSAVSGISDNSSITDNGKKPSAENDKYLVDFIDTILNGSQEEKEKLQRNFFEISKTPKFLKDVGLKGDNFLVSYGVISHHKGKDSDHNLSVDEWKSICEKISNPLMVTKFGKDFNLLLDVKHNGNYILVGASVKTPKKNLVINSVKTVFGKKNFFANESNILYIRKNLTTEQQAVLAGTNFQQYQGSVANSSDSSDELNIPQNTDLSSTKEFTNEETAKEMYNELKTREKLGLDVPNTDIGERSSTLKDSITELNDDSWNPNSENYRYKDTGYIAGSRKELAEQFFKDRVKNKQRTYENEIDWKGIEENPRLAEKYITKSAIFGTVDWEQLKNNGMTGGAAFLIDRIFASAGTMPTENNAEARRNYVIAINGLRDRFETCKTVDDVVDTLNEIREERNGIFKSVVESPEIQTEKARVNELKVKAESLKKTRDDLYKEYRNEEVAAQHQVRTKLLEYAREKKYIKWNQKYLYNSVYEEHPDLKVEEEKIKLQESKKAKELLQKLEDFEVQNGWFKENGHSVIKKVYSQNGSFDLVHNQAEKDYHEAEFKLNYSIKSKGARLVLSNPLHNAWAQLGSKCIVNDRYNQTFANHKMDARRGTYDDWKWANKDKIENTKKRSNDSIRFQLVVADKHNRKGGRDVSVKTTQELKEMFNLRDIQSGNWVLKDPDSAKWHIDRCCEGFADLCDITGIPEKLISLNGRLALAIGARGNGGKGAALAHYESLERVINITKMKGGGSLGHEWFHAFDNLISEAMSGGNINQFLTNPLENYKSESSKELAREYLKWKRLNDLEKTDTTAFNRELRSAGMTYANTEYYLRKAKEKLENKRLPIPQTNNFTESWQNDVKNAFDNLVKEMTVGNRLIKKQVKEELYLMRSYKKRVEEEDDFYAPHSLLNKAIKYLKDFPNYESAEIFINELSKNLNNDDLVRISKIAAAYFDKYKVLDNGKVELFIPDGTKASNYLAESKLIEAPGHNADYWSSVEEMAARAFSSYLEDKLKSSNRENTYLAHAANNEVPAYKMLGQKPYPEGEERTRINAAFDELFRVVKEHNAIQKSLRYEEIKKAFNSLCFNIQKSLRA